MACQIVYHYGNCLNTKKPFAHACRLCIESCPHQAISEYRQLETKHCTECGACTAVCPSDGFVDQMIDQLHDYLLKAEEIVLNCPQAVPMGFEISCLGILDRDLWMTLVLLAKEKPVTIITGVCAKCEDRQACAASVQTFKQVHADWPNHARVHIQVRPDQESVSNPEKAKFAVQHAERIGWREKSQEILVEWLPGLSADETYPIPRSRQCLMHVLEKSPEEKIPFQALTVENQCTSCGVCAGICPQGALQKREEMDPIIVDDKEDKILSLRLILEPEKCVQCGRCVEICPSQALSFSIKQLSHRHLTGKILIHEGSPRYCSHCGKRIFNNSELCLVCSTSGSNNGGYFFL